MKAFIIFTYERKNSKAWNCGNLLFLQIIIHLYYRLRPSITTGILHEQLYTHLSYIIRIKTDQHRSFIFVSNCLKHYMVAVHLFQKKLIAL